MSPRPAPEWLDAMREVLADGEWHPLEEVIRVGARYVPPNVALHHYSVQVAARHTGRLPTRVKAQTVHAKVRDGRWELCRRILQGWARKGTVEIQPKARKAPNKRIRLVR